MNDADNYLIKCHDGSWGGEGAVSIAKSSVEYLCLLAYEIDIFNKIPLILDAAVSVELPVILYQKDDLTKIRARFSKIKMVNSTTDRFNLILPCDFQLYANIEKINGVWKMIGEET